MLTVRGESLMSNSEDTVGAANHPKRTVVWCGKQLADAVDANIHVRAVIQGSRDVKHTGRWWRARFNWTQRLGKLTKSRQETGRVRNGRISGREEFTGKSKWGAIHQLGGAGTEIRLQRAADSKQDQGEVL